MTENAGLPVENPILGHHISGHLFFNYQLTDCNKIARHKYAMLKINRLWSKYPKYPKPKSGPGSSTTE